MFKIIAKYFRILLKKVLFKKKLGPKISCPILHRKTKPENKTNIETSMVMKSKSQKYESYLSLSTSGWFFASEGFIWI